MMDGRGGRIRTCDPLLPKQMRYRAALRPDDGAGVTRFVQRQQAKRLKAYLCGSVGGLMVMPIIGVFGDV